MNPPAAPAGPILEDWAQDQRLEQLSPEERDYATAAITSISAARGAWAVRVHDVGPSLDAVKVAARMSPGPFGDTSPTN